MLPDGGDRDRRVPTQHDGGQRVRHPPKNGLLPKQEEEEDGEEPLPLKDRDPRRQPQDDEDLSAAPARGDGSRQGERKATTERWGQRWVRTKQQFPLSFFSISGADGKKGVRISAEVVRFRFGNSEPACPIVEGREVGGFFHLVKCCVRGVVPAISTVATPRNNRMGRRGEREMGVGKGISGTLQFRRINGSSSPGNVLHVNNLLAFAWKKYGVLCMFLAYFLARGDFLPSLSIAT